MTQPEKKTVQRPTRAARAPVPPNAMHVRGRQRDSGDSGLSLGGGLIFRPRRMIRQGTTITITGVVRNSGRTSASLAQFLRLRHDGQPALYGSERKLEVHREMAVVVECEEPVQWLKRMQHGGGAKAALDRVVRVAQVPPEMARHLVR